MGIRRKTGGFADVELSATAQVAQGISIGLVGIGRDITERKQLEARLRQSQKMESLGTLAGGIAHDFNNILAAIGGYNDLAKMAAKDPAVTEHLDAIETATSRATELVRQILAFSRRQEPQRRPVPLREVIEESLRLLRAMMPSTIEISSTFSERPTIIEADPTQIHQIIINLGTNAAHAMSARGGKFEIKEEMIDLQAPVFG